MTNKPTFSQFRAGNFKVYQRAHDFGIYDQSGTLVAAATTHNTNLTTALHRAKVIAKAFQEDVEGSRTKLHIAVEAFLKIHEKDEVSFDNTTRPDNFRLSVCLGELRALREACQ